MKSAIYLFCVMAFAGLACAACVDVNETEPVNAALEIVPESLCYVIHTVDQSNYTVYLPVHDSSTQLGFSQNFFCVDNASASAPAFPAIDDDRNLFAGQNYTLPDARYNATFRCQAQLACPTPTPTPVPTPTPTPVICPTPTSTPVPTPTPTPVVCPTTTPADCRQNLSVVISPGTGNFSNAAANINVSADCRRNLTLAPGFGQNATDAPANVTCAGPPISALNASLGFGECNSWEGREVCCPAFPRIDESVNLTENSSKTWDAYNASCRCLNTSQACPTQPVINISAELPRNTTECETIISKAGIDFCADRYPDCSASALLEDGPTKCYMDLYERTLSSIPAIRERYSDQITALENDSRSCLNDLNRTSERLGDCEDENANVGLVIIAAGIIIFGVCVVFAFLRYMESTHKKQMSAADEIHLRAGSLEDAQKSEGEKHG